MIENITITTGVAIVALSWICGTAYSIVRRNPAGLEGAFWITIGYGMFRFFLILPPK